MSTPEPYLTGRFTSPYLNLGAALELEKGCDRTLADI